MLAHSVVGSGARPIFLLHGFLGSGRNLSTLARRWSSRDPSLRLVVPDLTGHGVSPPLPPGAGLATLAGDVLGLARHLHVEHPLEIVGHSLGGRVALKAAELERGRIARITLLDISPDPILVGDFVLDALVAAPEHPLDRNEVRAFLVERGVPPSVAEWLLMNLVRDEGGYHWRIDRIAMTRLRAAGNHDDLWSVVESASVRVRCIRGGQSGYVGDEAFARLLRAGARVETIAGAGHFLHIDTPPELLELLSDDAW